MPTGEPDPPDGAKNGLSVLGVLPRLSENYAVPIAQPPPREPSPECVVGRVYPFEPPDSPTTWEPHPDIELVPGGGEGSSKPHTASPSTVSTAPVKRPRAGTTYKQQTLWGAPPPQNATSHKRHAPSADPKPPTALADAEYESVKKTFEAQWACSFKWLRLLRMSNGCPSLKCAICVKHGDPLAHTAYGAKGEGARDLQIGSIRTHSSTCAHKNAAETQKKAEAEKVKQATLTRWQITDASTRHIIRLLHIALFVCKADAPIAMFGAPRGDEKGAARPPPRGAATGTREGAATGPQSRLDGRRGGRRAGPPKSPRRATGGDRARPPWSPRRATGGEAARVPKVASTGDGRGGRAGPRASAAAEEVPELQMIDDVVRAFADHIGRSSVDYQKFQEMQRIFCQTNLEAQGISDTRRLARGEAIQRLLDVLPAAMVVLKDYKAELYEVVTSFKFHWLIRFLADVLWELNCLKLPAAAGHETDGDVTACVELSIKYVRAIDAELE
ncbi:unnamed protein product [Closterium sp. Naga37s-1]|nr:unnamed protein product [Closterium sp. Naga37s-1]